MISFQLTRFKKSSEIQAFRKSHKVLAKQIVNGFNSSPLAETHFVDVKISDKPITRFFIKLFGKNDKELEVNLKAKFVRAYKDGDSFSAKHYDYKDTFNISELDEIKSGKNLLEKENSFVNKFAKWINKNIGE